MAGREGHDQGDQREGPGPAHGLEPRERLKVRLLLLSPARRLLLMRFEDPSIQGAAQAGWCTAGGGVNEGETLEDAARRELLEETGHAEVELGPVVWRRELVLPVDGEPRRLVEHYFLARALHEELTDHGWTETERRVVKAMRWWTVEELAASEETIFPAGLAGMLGALLAGALPTEPVQIP